ncbi:MAG TPA: amidohydrolase family protein [Chloroflexota bacterium]|nr:amidohydrolase family protein [Chloroflexota bacterium]
MGVIDVHQHLIKYQSYEPGYRAHLESTQPEYFGSMMAKYSQPAEMDAMLAEAGVEAAFVMAEDAPLTTGLASSEYVSGFVRQTKRMRFFASINPMTKLDAAKQLEHDVKVLGASGLKLYPSYQWFYPNDRALYPLYAKAIELGVPVTFHTGSSTFVGSRIKYSEPIHLDDVGVDFPELVILMAHAGRPFWYDEAEWLVKRHPNLYIDIAGLPPKRLPQYLPDLERISYKVLFGSDWPSIPSGLAANIEQVRALPISEEAKENILSGNARRVLKL